MYTHTLVRIGYRFVHSIDIPLSFSFYSTGFVCTPVRGSLYIDIGLCMNVEIGSSSSYNYITGLY